MIFKECICVALLQYKYSSSATQMLYISTSAVPVLLVILKLFFMILRISKNYFGFTEAVAFPPYRLKLNQGNVYALSNMH